MGRASKVKVFSVVTNLDPMNRGLKLLTCELAGSQGRSYKPRPDE